MNKTGNTISKTDMPDSRFLQNASTGDVVFYHKATAGQLSISLLALTMPSELPFSQATIGQLTGAKMYQNRKSMVLKSSAYGPLFQGLHFDVVDGFTIILKGPYATTGAAEGEIFEGKLKGAVTSDLIVASAKTQMENYELAIGQNLLNLGKAYKVGGKVMKVFINGVLAGANEYEEVDAGNGWGTYINIFAAPVTVPYSVDVDFGVLAITDTNAMDTIESLAGSVKKLADDLAQVAGTDPDDYLNANPSEVERRAFGDKLLAHDALLDQETSVKTFTKTKYQYFTGAQRTTVGVIAQANNLEIGKTYRVSAFVYTNCGGGAAMTARLDFNGVTGQRSASFETQGTIGADKMPGHLYAVFKATATTCVLYCAGITTSQTMRGDMTVEEVPNHEETTQWT